MDMGGGYNEADCLDDDEDMDEVEDDEDEDDKAGERENETCEGTWLKPPFGANSPPFFI